MLDIYENNKTILSFSFKALGNIMSTLQKGQIDNKEELSLKVQAQFLVRIHPASIAGDGCFTQILRIYCEIYIRHIFFFSVPCILMSQQSHGIKMICSLVVLHLHLSKTKQTLFTTCCVNILDITVETIKDEADSIPLFTTFCHKSIVDI